MPNFFALSENMINSAYSNVSKPTKSHERDKTDFKSY